EDLHHIFLYIQLDAPNSAKDVINRILAHIELISKQPLMGRKVTEVKDTNIRETLSGKYRIIYEVGPDIITLRTIIHGARDFKHV
ncbi:MAG: type II toxin-antitoxin system RelE/ParE family toxin, partial [Leptospiraceae bacterium]|nr:type II toxin-antitoxin system RelE/ParE family toxin [Leptospiraceae bacterium]